jgi:uncharacterized membrane protein
MSNNATPVGGFDFNRPTIVSLLYLGSWVTGGLTGLIGAVLAFIWKGEAQEAWESTHYAYLINTFWIMVVGTILAVLLTITIILAIFGIPLGIGVGIWATVRAVMSLVKAQRREPMPNPGTWGF